MEDSTSTPIRILLVEDDGGIGYFIKMTVQELPVPCHVDHAMSGDEALEYWHKQPYDLLLTDYNLRGRNGLELVNQIKSEGADIPVVLFTAYDTPKLRSQARDAGINEFIAKPFFLDDFVARIRTLLPLIKQGANTKAALPSA